MGCNKVAVETVRLTKIFKSPAGPVTALKELNLQVRNGEFVCVVGPSGCGKTTLLRIMAGLEQQTSGKVCVHRHSRGKPLTAMVFQSDSIFPWMTVRRNIGYGLEVRGTAKEKRGEIVDKLLAMTGLTAFSSNYPHQLSGGMKQRVNVARAFAADPEILLMDEPFGLLDEQNRLILQRQLMDIWQDTQKTTVFITHSVDEALILGDRLLVMTALPGRIKQMIDIDLERPRDIISLRGDHRFINLYTQVWRLLSEEVERSRRQPGGIAAGI